MEKMNLTKEIRLLINQYVSEQNAHSISNAYAIDPGMGCLHTCSVFPTAGNCSWERCLQKQKKCPKKSNN